MSKIKVAVAGAAGRMGQEVVRAVLADDKCSLVCAIDVFKAGEDIGEVISNEKLGVLIEDNLEQALKSKKPDVVVDFTQPNSIFNNAKVALNAGVRPVIGTTGLTSEQLAELEKLSEEKKLGCLIAPNFAIGAVLMMMFSKKAAEYFDNAEIIELHHNQKKDAPSGTAIKTAQLMSEVKADFEKGNCEEVELIERSRGGIAPSNIRVHSVRMPGYIASQEVIFGSNGQTLKVRHDSINRECFMPGVILSIKHCFEKNDFVYGLENIL